MAAARHAAVVLAGTGGPYLEHGLGMPDNSVIARLRAFLEESGFPLILAQTVRMAINPSRVVQALSMCLALEMASLAIWLESVLAEQAGTGQGLLRLPGAEEGGPEAFMQAWIGYLHQLTDRARGRRSVTPEDADGARPSMERRADAVPAGSSSTEQQYGAAARTR
ncbi:hypothetical protein [Streptomyces sp. NPDC054842]